MRQPLQEFVAAVMVHDRLRDDGAQRRHAGRQPRRNASAMQGKIGAAGASCHSLLRLQSSRVITEVRARRQDFSGHRPEGDRVSPRLDGRDAVLPDLPRRPRHHVERSWPSLERETFPLSVGGPSKPQLAGRSQRQAEHPVEVRLVSVPADPDADVVLGTKDLANSGFWATESFDFLDYRAQPLGYRIGLLEPSHGIVVSKSERGYAALAFVLAELERLQLQSRDVPD